MEKCEYVGFRATSDERAKIKRLASSAGMNASEVLRALVNSAKLESDQQLQPVARLASREAVQ